jgi:hypothetical protein
MEISQVYWHRNVILALGRQGRRISSSRQLGLPREILSKKTKQAKEGNRAKIIYIHFP